MFLLVFEFIDFFVDVLNFVEIFQVEERVGNPIKLMVDFLFVFVLRAGLLPKEVHFFEPIFTVEIIKLRSSVSFEIRF